MSSAYSVAEEMGILVNFESPSKMTTSDVISRVMSHRSEFMKKFSKRSKKEETYYSEKSFVEEK